jgi:hypothetical protein
LICVCFFFFFFFSMEISYFFFLTYLLVSNVPWIEDPGSNRDDVKLRELPLPRTGARGRLSKTKRGEKIKKRENSEKEKRSLSLIVEICNV